MRLAPAARADPPQAAATRAPQRYSSFLQRGDKLPASTVATEDQMHTQSMVLRALGVGILVSVLSGCSCTYGERPGGHSCRGPMGSLDTQPEHRLATAGMDLRGGPLHS